MGDRAGSSPVTRIKKKDLGHVPRVLLLNVGGDLEPEVQGLGFASVGPEPTSPGRCGPCHPHASGDPALRFKVVFVSLRSAQSQGPPDLVGRFASVGAEQMSTGHFAPCHPRVETLYQRFKVVAEGVWKKFD